MRRPKTTAPTETPDVEQVVDVVAVPLDPPTRRRRASTSEVAAAVRETDLGNAEKLVALHGEDLRHVGGWGWLAWDGRRWPAAEHGAGLRFAASTSKVLVAEALEETRTANATFAAAPDDPTAVKAKKAADKFLSWAIKSQNQRPLEAMLGLARSDASVAVTHERLDADPWLLNVENGTVDLRTGKLRPHDRRDLCTKLAPVVYDPNAKCPTWDSFIDRAMGGDPELVAYLRRVVGYSITGSTREHILGFFFGGGANGKSTFLVTIGAMLGDYAGPAPRGLLFRARGERHPTEYAALHGKRFVTLAEIEAGASFDEALVKDLTGGDVISTRRMREDFWSFVPSHKLFIAGNSKPTVRGDDDGIWRRLRLVPFTVTIPERERDTRLPEKLCAELPGILAWAVRGCLEWQAQGLGDPPAVTAATRDYRTESDTIGDFFRSCLTFTADGRIARKELRELYERWAKDNGYDHLAGPKKIAERLRAQGVSECTVRGVDARVYDGWKGVRENTAAERAARTWTVGSRDLQGPDPGKCSTRAHGGATNRDPSTTGPYAPTERGVS